MNSLEILRSFTDEEFYKVWCIVHYKFNGKRDTFWERSRNTNELKVGISCNVPGEELKVYNKPLHAEKYAIGRLKIKLRNETISFNESWWVNMYTTTKTIMFTFSLFFIHLNAEPGPR